MKLSNRKEVINFKKDQISFEKITVHEVLANLEAEDQEEEDVFDSDPEEACEEVLFFNNGRILRTIRKVFKYYSNNGLQRIRILFVLYFSMNTNSEYNLFQIFNVYDYEYYLWHELFESFE